MSGNAWSSPSTTAVDDDVGVKDAAVDSVAVEAPEAEEPAPVGTLFFMILFLLVMVGLWVTVYWMLLER